MAIAGLSADTGGLVSRQEDVDSFMVSVGILWSGVNTRARAISLAEETQKPREAARSAWHSRRIHTDCLRPVRVHAVSRYDRVLREMTYQLFATHNGPTKIGVQILPTSIDGVV